MFECIPSETYDLNAVGPVLAGKITKRIPICSNTRVGAIAVSAPSLGTFIKHVLETCPEPRRSGESSSVGAKGYFLLFETFEEAVDTFLNRPHTLKEFKPEDERLAMKDEIGTDAQWDVTGDFIDIGKYLEGDPECFGYFTYGNPRNLFATIVINTAASGGIKAEVLAHRAKRLLRLVDWLENNQIRVQVKLVNTNDCSYVECGIKSFDQHLDMDALAISVHPDFHRRIIFRLREYSDTWESGYGRTCRISDGSMEFPPAFEQQQGIFLFTENHGSIESVDKHFNAVEEQIRKMLENGERNLSAIF